MRWTFHIFWNFGAAWHRLEQTMLPDSLFTLSSVYIMVKSNSMVLLFSILQWENNLLFHRKWKYAIVVFEENCHFWQDCQHNYVLDQPWKVILCLKMILNLDSMVTKILAPIFREELFVEMMNFVLSSCTCSRLPVWADFVQFGLKLNIKLGLNHHHHPPPPTTHHQELFKGF